MEKKLSSKYIHMYMSISRVFIRLTGNVLKLFPFAMVICPVVWFYLCPEHIISDIVNDWQDADTLEKNTACQTVSEDGSYSDSGKRCCLVSFVR
ncbi:TPA: hypothetical protein ACHGTX_003897 [Escherichia coli]|nr:hypothetical protein [Escherichia coli]